MKESHQKLLRRAQSLERAGKPSEAAAAYRAYLETAPNHVNIWSDYAGQLLRLERYEDAEEACARALALDAGHASARINQGILQMRRGRLREAEGILRAVQDDFPRRPDASLFLAECLLKRKRPDQACQVLEACTRPGVLLGPLAAMKLHAAELWAIAGLAFLEVQRFAECQDACQTALRLDPGNLRAQANLGSLQMAQGHLDQAESELLRLVSIHPTDTNARLLLITCLGRLGKLDRLQQEIKQVLRQAPEDFVVHKSLAGTYYTLGLWDDYRNEIERYRQVAPEAAYPDFELSLVELMFGDYLNGWAHYEARLKVPEKLRLNQRHFDQPAWDGSPFPDRTLLVWCEQGLGDTLMFVRYLPLVKALGGRVFLEAQPELVDVAATCPGVDLVIPKGLPFPPFDLQISVMSLPWLFRTEVSTIPANVPYLTVPDVVPRQADLRACLDAAADRVRIGLVWAGNPGHGRDFERSLTPNTLAPLAELPGVAWFSFQLGRSEFPPLPGLVSLAPHLTTFSDSAYALNDMDLLMTVDTSIAHLAGALGVPTLLLLSYQPDFRWLLGRDDSPWYPTLRLYRQPAYGDWDSVIKQVVSDLQAGG